MVKVIFRIMVILLAMVIAQPIEAAPKKDKKGKKEQVSMNSPLAADEIRLVVSGEGQTKEEAVKNALRSAIEQNYGVFVSSNTSFINDELVKDEIATVASGNIRNYNIIKEESKDNIYNVTVDAIVSVGKLMSFVKSKGGDVEMDGNTFAMNFNINKVKEENTRKAIEHLKEEIANMLKNNCYDFAIEVGEPRRVGEDVAEVDLKIKTTLNQNFYDAEAYARKIIETLSVPIPVVKSESNLSSFSANYWGEKYGELGRGVNEIIDNILNDKYDTQNVGEYNVFTNRTENIRERKYYGKFKGRAGAEYREFTEEDLNDVFFIRGISASPDEIIPAIGEQALNFIISDGINEYMPMLKKFVEQGRGDVWKYTIVPKDPTKGLLSLNGRYFNTWYYTVNFGNYRQGIRQRSESESLRYPNQPEFEVTIMYPLENISKIKGYTVNPISEGQRKIFLQEFRETPFSQFLDE